MTIKSKLYQKGRGLSKYALQILNGGLLVQYRGMKRPQYVFRPNLNEPQHRRAWALLQQMPPAKRKEFLVQSILAAEQTDRLEKSIRKVVREELQAVNITNAVPSPLSENAIPDSALDFLNSL